VHLSDFPKYDASLVDKDLEERMELAQKISSMVFSLRKKVNIRVRQPLKKILLPVTGDGFREKIDKVKDLILAEVNVKEIEYIADTSGLLVKKIKPNFRLLGKKVGSLMKDAAFFIGNMSQEDIQKMESDKKLDVLIANQPVTLTEEDVEISSEDIPGWQVANEGKLTVALDITVSEDLREEGIAREFINRIQNLRKEKGFEVTDRIDLKVLEHASIRSSLINNKEYICAETLTANLDIVDRLDGEDAVNVEVDEDIHTRISIRKHDSVGLN
jgi:isoleucyl-tRNA synthetase